MYRSKSLVGSWAWVNYLQLSRSLEMWKPVLLLGAAIAGPSPGAAQELARTAYYDFLPPQSPIVAQTAASLRLHLFGDERDPSYRDVSAVDGIDDVRASRLLHIAERFSPVMRRNNFSVPRDLDATLGPVHYLTIDTWQRGRLVRTDSIALEHRTDRPRLAGSLSDDHVVASAESTGVRLRELIEQEGPRAGRPAITPAEGETARVLYFDQPGRDPASWRRTFSRVDPKTGSKAFAHPFITEVADGAAQSERYLLVMQYWFFYPFNDAVNTHEGDWEHINVLVTTKERARDANPATFRRALLNESDVQRILSPSYIIEDSLIIAGVDYFFHQNVTTLDYVAARANEDLLASARRDDARYVWEDVHFIRDAIRGRLEAGAGRLATHPVVYIGGDNKGPDELLVLRPRFLASFKRNSGSSYPFPGVWQTVAGFGVTEKVNGRAIPELSGPDSCPWYDAIDPEEYVAFPARNIILVPDWERVEQVLNTGGDVRAQWSWLMLPIYWGFPVMRSTGAGLLKHVDLGNVAPMGPAYQSGWNRIGADPDYAEYGVRVLRTPVSPTTRWAIVHNGWGVLNLPLAAWGLMPGYNVVLVEFMPWIGGTMNFFGAPPPRTYLPDRLPSRFTTAAEGAFIDFGGQAFAGMLPRRNLDLGPANTSGTPGEVRRARRAHVGPRIWFNLYSGERLSLENTYSVATSDLRYDFTPPEGGSSHLTAILRMRQLTGGLRYDAFRQGNGALRLYARGGYGWLSYRASSLALDSTLLEGATVRGGYLPPLLPSHDWWPNTWYGGGGLEIFSPRRYYLLHLLGYGARIEFTELFNKLSFKEASGAGDVVARRGDLALSVVFGW